MNAIQRQPGQKAGWVKEIIIEGTVVVGDGGIIALNNGCAVVQGVTPSPSGGRIRVVGGGPGAESHPSV